MALWFSPLPFQAKAIERLVDTPYCALFAPPGTAGKTAIALSVLKITRTLNRRRRALVIAPLPVCMSTWPDEIKKWHQFNELDFAIARGKSREGAFSHDITLINPELIPWLESRSKLLASHNTLIVDESTLFKNWTGKRTKYLKRLLPQFSRRHILTGTPTPNSLLEWFSQQFIVDGGQSFGTTITPFKNRWFYPTDYKRWNWAPFKETATQLAELAAPFVHTVESDARIPGLDTIDREVEMPDSALKAYRDMQRKLVAQVQEGSLSAVSSGVAYGHCRRIAAGAVYPNKASRDYETIHTAKWDMAVEIIRALNGLPVLVCYQYDFEAEEMKKRLRGICPSSKVRELNGGVSAGEKKSTIRKWSRGKLQVLLMQPQSGAHGLNLQGRRNHHMIWLTLPDSAELYEQANCRLRRLGSGGRTVTAYRILTKRTVETGVVRARLAARISQQDALISYCRELSKNSD